MRRSDTQKMHMREPAQGIFSSAISERCKTGEYPIVSTFG
jgi:hypothetical protein